MNDNKIEDIICIGIRRRDIYKFPEYIVHLGDQMTIHLTWQKALDDVKRIISHYKDDPVRLYLTPPLTMTVEEGEYVSEGKLKCYYTWNIKPEEKKAE